MDVQFSGCSATVGITTVQIEILGAKFQVSGPRCAPHNFSGPVFHYARDHYATVQIDILGAKFQILGPRCAPHYFSGPSQNLLGAKNQFA